MAVEKIDANTLRITEQSIITQSRDELLVNKDCLEEEIRKAQAALAVIDERIRLLDS